MDITDRATGIRQGEELDTDKVGEYLRGSLAGLSGEMVVEQFPSGFSNLTYLIRVGDTELVLRRPPFGTKAKSAHDMGREYRILSALKDVYPYCPRPLIYCGDESVMGCPFYVMERIKGIILRKDPPKGLEFSPSDMRTLCENLLDVHYRLHAIDYKAIGLADFGRPEGYVKRQVQGWSERYRAARTPDAPDFENVMLWLAERMPPDFPKPGIIHNDYKFDNVVLNPDNPLEIIGVLDWEMATIGDPLMDLGSSLGYWVQADDPQDFQAARMLPTTLPGALTRAEMVQRYADLAGVRIDNFDFYLCFGLFRLAVIAQQIYYRFYHGQTKDERFKMLIFAVHILEQAALRTMKESRA
ncbi:MAG: phosphotransferase family protein [Desulfomonilia bacterium]|jgi:aminoglycoside phosphotransferase (APT) family kinase protein|uniref:Putative aminoglycoside phosphotransferase n=1 Tax=anaerobic digester metagenome TaxID=1263854 RepID=A0A485M3Z9_9ZZZZ|nr:phosphotransferase family protein [Pseudomonadota bacterium]HON38784.1 phosphotransferase family protein [Deltaproteobacteria bacterium]HRS56661.1 phosphotransferase family protein [Desulfomonilia bacterium]HPD20278.1 phosphotransferase family protein [Deltaproteobacteria bacterium]HPX17663.1 phosphotransferase family protein [Deltaproteobacteria bacterium]